MAVHPGVAEPAQEDAFERAEGPFRTLVEASPNALVMVAPDGTITLANRRVEPMFGYKPEELLGHKIEMLVPERFRPKHASYREGFVADPHQRPMGAGRDLFALRKDGREIPVEIGLTPIETSAGTFTMATVTDITERKRREEELRVTADELARSNKDLEQFAYVASHDLQEPLRMVASFLKLLDQQYQGQLDERAQEYIRFAVDGALRMQDLVKALLDYSRVGTRGGRFEQVDMSQVFGDVRLNLRSAIEESGATIDCGPLPEVYGDRTQLMQLLQNLVGNAVKFRDGSRPLAVQIRAERQEGGWLFSVADNGIGFDPKYAQQVFLVFRRLNTRSRYPGTGIGLAICKKIVERHGGTISAQSQPGAGSTFTFTIADRKKAP